MPERDRLQSIERFLRRADLARSSLWAEIESTVALGRDLSPEERDRDLVGLCRDAWAILETRDDMERVVGWVDPPAPDFPEKWRTLVERYRAQRRRVSGTP